MRLPHPWTRALNARDTRNVQPRTIDVSALWPKIRVLNRGLVEIPGAWVNPFTVSGDGRLVFATIHTDDWAGVAAIPTDGSGYTRIFQFANPDMDQVTGGSFDGRWLVWSESHDPADRGDWSIRAWDAESGQVQTVAEAPRKDGRTIPGPFVFPTVDHGMVAWAQASPEGGREIHLYSLADRRDRTLAAGDVGSSPVTFWWPYIIWQVRDQSGPEDRAGRVMTADATTGEPVEPTPAPAAIRQLWFMAASESVLAWTDGGILWVWRPGEAAARAVFRAPDGDYIQFLSIAGDLTTWDGVTGPWVADLRSGSVAKLPQLYGGRHARGTALLVVEPTSQVRSRHPPLRIRFADVGQFEPLPTCASSTPETD